MEAALRKQNGMVDTAHRPGGTRAKGSLATDPAHDGGRAGIEEPGDSATGLAGRDGRHDAFTKVH